MFELEAKGLVFPDSSPDFAGNTLSLDIAVTEKFDLERPFRWCMRLNQSTMPMGTFKLQILRVWDGFSRKGEWHHS